LGFGREKLLLDIQGTTARESEIPPLRTVKLFRHNRREQADIEETKKYDQLYNLV